MKTSSGRTKGVVGGVVFSAAEERAVKIINNVVKGVHGANYKIGRAVDDLVEERGGVRYGDSTLERLARHPKLDCCYEQVRKCWHYYRFLRSYGKDVRGIARLSFSHLYQLSRLLDVTNEAARCTAIIEMAKKAADERLNSTDLAEAVTDYLAGQRGESGRKPKTPNAPLGSGTDHKLYVKLTKTSRSVVAAAKRITESADLALGHEVSEATDRLGFVYVQLIRKLVAARFDGAVDAAKKVIGSIEAAIVQGDNSHVSA